MLSIRGSRAGASFQVSSDPCPSVGASEQETNHDNPVEFLFRRLRCRTLIVEILGFGCLVGDRGR
jgi:hypothetical protein